MSSLNDTEVKDTPQVAETDIDAGSEVGVGVSDVAEEGAAAAAGEVDLRKNPGVPSEGPSAPVFEEWYHGKISRKEVRVWSYHFALFLFYLVPFCFGIGIFSRFPCILLSLSTVFKLVYSYMSFQCINGSLFCV